MGKFLNLKFKAVAAQKKFGYNGRKFNIFFFISRLNKDLIILLGALYAVTCKVNIYSL